MLDGPKLRLALCVQQQQCTLLPPYDTCMRARRQRRAAVVVRAEEKATLDLNEGVEGGTDYSGILAGACMHAYATTLL